MLLRASIHHRPSSYKAHTHHRRYLINNLRIPSFRSLFSPSARLRFFLIFPFFSFPILTAAFVSLISRLTDTRRTSPNSANTPRHSLDARFIGYFSSCRESLSRGAKARACVYRVNIRRKAAELAAQRSDEKHTIWWRINKYISGRFERLHPPL